MKKIIIFFAFCLFSLSGICQSLKQKLDDFITLYASNNQFNGSVLIAQRGNILLQKGYGRKNVKEGSLNDANTIFQIGSVTKPFTAAIILQLQEKKKLSVYDPISKYFPGFPNGEKITIEHLITHTSGLYNYTNDEVFIKNDAVKSSSPEKMMSLFRDRSLSFEPGSKYNYSNSGYILLGYIIEKVTGKSYFQVVRENIFGPLGMSHSGFNFSSLRSPDKATGYSSLTSKGNKPANVFDSSASHAAGAIYSSLNDLYKWDRALYSGKILSAASLQAAFKPNKGDYGYGWRIDWTADNKTVYHTGGIFGFAAIICRVLGDETCIILLDNHESPSLEKMADGLNAIVHRTAYELPRLKTEVKLNDDLLRLYTGEYELAPGFILTVTVDEGQLMTQATGQDKAPAFAEKENLFFLKVVDAQLEFIKGPDGKIEKLILYQNGRKTPARKIK